MVDELVSNKRPATYEIAASASLLKSVYEGKADHFPYLEPPSDESLWNERERNPEYLANRLNGIIAGDKIKFVLDPVESKDNPYLKGVPLSGIELTVKSISRSPSVAGRNMVVLRF